MAPHAWVQWSGETGVGRTRRLVFGHIDEGLDIRYVPPECFFELALRHLQSAKASTPFSSWTHDWSTAVAFATTRGGVGDPLPSSMLGHIAVLDVRRWLKDQEHDCRIFHSPALAKTPDKLGVDLKAPESLRCEFIIWGPIYGPAYRILSAYTIRQTTGLGAWPWAEQHGPMIPHVVSRDEALTAVRLGMMFCGPDKDPADIALAIVVAAAELSRCQYVAPKAGRFGWAIRSDYRNLKLRWSYKLGEVDLAEQIMLLLSELIPGYSTPQLLVHLHANNLNSSHAQGFPQYELQCSLLWAIQHKMAGKWWSTCDRLGQHAQPNAWVYVSKHFYKANIHPSCG